MRILTIGEFAKAIGKSQGTLRNWEISGKLVPHHKTDNGTRYYTESQVDEYFHKNRSRLVRKRKVIGYCRVSDENKQKDLQRQVDMVKTHCICRGYQFEIIEDVGRVVEYSRRGLNELIKTITSRQVDKIVLLYKDVLAGFGFELIQNICDSFDVDIEVIENSQRLDEDEIYEDMIQVMTSFICKLGNKKSCDAKRFIKEMMEL